MHCIVNCISKTYLMPAKQLTKALKVVDYVGYQKQTGRPPINPKLVLHALYYMARTGIQWNALPRCFGASSTLHAAFQRLVYLGFFDNFWIEGLEEYDEKIGLDLKRKVGDCSHVKSPMGKDAVGPSPVDRRKQGTKRSLLVDGNGILIGCVLAGGNRNDAKMLRQTLESTPLQFQSDGTHHLWLDAAYDSQEVRMICFRYRLRPHISPNSRRKPVEPVRPVIRGVRWVVERTHSWINRFRRIFVRYDKLPENYLSFIKFAAVSFIFSRLGVSG